MKLIIKKYSSNILGMYKICDEKGYIQYHVVHESAGKLRLYEGDNGRFILFPSRTSKKGRKFDVAFPCKDEMREMILKEIEIEYLNEVLK